MKKILVPTDFSPVADNALQYAIEVAAGFKSEIYLYHMYSFDSFNYDGNFPRYDQPYTKKMVREMERTKLKFKEKITEKGLSMQTFVEEDSIYSLFKTKVIMHEINMIVMGSRGASGMTKLFFGSVATTALDMAKVPVLIVPPDH
ncbi:MAG: universal stress protein, partial [Robiginitalea sp.]|uniref:universal stress protein n=1 Tax=Robiginitalea sp. TaxID=1902411 RepID=UPI003C746ED3